MTHKDILNEVKKLGISNKLPNDPGLFQLHQKIGYLLDSGAFTRRENNIVHREIDNEFIDPIP